METLTDNKKSDLQYEDFNEPLNFNSKRLINGINIKDLCNGEEIMFEINKDVRENVEDSDEEISDEFVFYDPKTMRERRGAPPINCSFKEIANKMTNVTENGFVKKQIVTSGIGKTVPDHAYVTVHYNLYKESCEIPFDSTYLRNRPEKFRLDQGEAILGLEYAIKSMKKNENSMFFIKWEVAFGALGCPDRIEKECDIVADLTLINFVEIDTERELAELSLSDISKIDFTKFMNQAKQLLCNGSDEFLKGDTKAAILSYRKALGILNNLRLANDEQESQMFKQKVKCLVNLAVCYNKLGKSEQACVACQEALSIDHSSVKANFHYGRACIALSNFGVAQRCLLKADRLKPNDKDINREIKKLNDKRALYEAKDKIFWKKAFEEKEEKKAKTEQPSALDIFEKNLISSLEESVNEKKPYIMSLPLLEDEIKICNKVAAQMNIQFEEHPHFCIFKSAQNNSKESSK